MLALVLAIRFGGYDTADYTLFEQNRTEIVNTLQYAMEESGKLGKECYYNYGGYWDENYVAVQGTCVYDTYYYDVILIAKYTTGYDLEGNTKYSWERHWK